MKTYVFEDVYYTSENGFTEEAELVIPEDDKFIRPEED